MGNHYLWWELHWSWLVSVSLLLLLSVENSLEGVLVTKNTCVLMVILQSWTEVITALMDQTRSVILKEEAESARVDVTATAWIESALVIQIWEDTEGDVLLHVTGGEGRRELHSNNTPNHKYNFLHVVSPLWRLTRRKPFVFKPWRLKSLISVIQT